MSELMGAFILIVSGFTVLMLTLCGIGAIFEGLKFIFKRVFKR